MTEFWRGFRYGTLLWLAIAIAGLLAVLMFIMEGYP